MDICSVQETKIKEDVDCFVGQYRFFNLEKRTHHDGLGFFVHRDLEHRVVNVRYEDDKGQIASLQLRTTDPKKLLTVINVHAPTAEKPEHVHGEFHERLERTFCKYRGSQLVLLCGDFNAEVGKRTDEDTCVGRHTTESERTVQGEQLVSFCERHQLFICNTAFEQSRRARTTHRGTNKNGEFYYRQIDYIMCPKKVKGMLTNCRSYAKTIDSDHRLLVARLELPRYYGLMGIQKQRAEVKRTTRYEVERLKDPQVSMKYKAALSTEFKAIRETEITSGKEQWEAMCECIKTVAEVTIGVKAKDGRKRAFIDDKLAEWSDRQRQLRLDILSCPNADKRQQMKSERMDLMKLIKRRVKQLRTEAIEAKVAAVDKCKDSAKMFQAIREVQEFGKARQKLVVHNEQGDRIIDDKEVAEYVKAHFVTQFIDVRMPPLDDNTSEPRPLLCQIKPSEVDRATRKLKNGRAVGLDNLCAELVKHGPPELPSMLADVLNKALALGEDLGLGLAKLITLPKPGKPAGPVKNIRPIALLPLLRKILSLITLFRIRGPVDLYLSPAQAAYRPGRAGADLVWAHRWLIAKSLRYKVAIHVLGLDMSRAFDTIDRSKLMSILDTVPGLTDDDRRLVRVLLANTSISVHVNGITTTPFISTIGSPQGDALSPILFAIYLEAAIRELYARGLKRPECDTKLPGNAIYADDTDFISLCSKYLDEVLHTVGPVFDEYNLLVNVEKTEHIIIGLADIGIDESTWRSARKLGSLLGDQQDVHRRIQLAWQSFNKLEALWKHRNRVAVSTRRKSFSALVESVLLFNCGTWALTVELADRLDSAHRKMLRRVLGLKWSDYVGNVDFYARFNIVPASIQALNARWRLFGHTLRMNDGTPARQAMSYYFERNHKGRQGHRIHIASKLFAEYESVRGQVIVSRIDFDKLVRLAQDREVWKRLVDDVTSKYHQLFTDKEVKRATARKLYKVKAAKVQCVKVD